jgi:hypothetical protein
VDAATKDCLLDFQEKVVPLIEKTEPVYDVGLWGFDTCPASLNPTMDGKGADNIFFHVDLVSLCIEL